MADHESAKAVGHCAEDGGPDESAVQGTTLMYRFRFNSTRQAPDPDTDGCPDTCAGWAIDDVALNNDDEDVGYSTSFDIAIDPTQ